MRELTIDTPGDRSAREGLSHGSPPETLSHRLRRGRILVWQLRRGAILAATRFPTHISCAAIYDTKGLLRRAYYERWEGLENQRDLSGGGGLKRAMSMRRRGRASRQLVQELPRVN